MHTVAYMAVVLALGLGCAPKLPTDPELALVENGEELFFNETFDGNGRTCGTCHPAENNLTIDPGFIARLPDDDPLFVAEFVPELAANFEKPGLMREFGLILENLDGFDDLENQFVMRGVPHTLALSTSIDSPAGPRLGWSGDGSPGDGSLRSFATGAVIQHFTKTTLRRVGLDFRLPTDEELDALEAFQASLGRQQELALPLSLRGTSARRGQDIFLDPALGKCNICHQNAGANTSLNGQDLGNMNFDTGVESLPDQGPDLSPEPPPLDDGLGTPGDGTFNTPPLVEAADTAPFFHNNSIDTIEGAVAFYDGQSFNQSPAGVFLAALDPNGVGIQLDATQIEAVAAFLRVLGSLENIRESVALLERSKREHRAAVAARLRSRALAEAGDAGRVLAEAGLHAEAVQRLEAAERLIAKAIRRWFGRVSLTRAALRELEAARATLIEPDRTAG